MRKYLILFFTILWVLGSAQQADVQPNPFDFGKMWTFENPPIDWFKEAYDFDPGQGWFDDVRKSSLRFATWCSASFVSPDGLIMTNHHCSRDVVAGLQLENENFDKSGFYAASLADERKAEGLFVEQLLMATDITEELKLRAENEEGETEAERMEAAIKSTQAKYESMPGWEGLRQQVVSYYSGGKYSLYGYKRYDDIRLVWIPEVELGFFGGDPDNFTYPRYNLDCTFWRAYDENGMPMDTKDHYLEFNPEGAQEGEPVFVVGNPGTTERYRTIAQLEYDRDIRYPPTYRFLKNRNDMMMSDYNEIKDDPTKEKEAQALLNQIANVANGMKAYGGIIKGLNDEALFKRKVDMEAYIRSKSTDVDYWDQLSSEYEKLEPYGWAVTTLGPSGLKGSIYNMIFTLGAYDNMIKEGAPDEELTKVREEIMRSQPMLEDADEQDYLTLLLNEVKEAIPDNNMVLSQILDGKDIDVFVDYLIDETKFTSPSKAEKMLSKTKKFSKQKDPLVKMGRIVYNTYLDASNKFRSSGPLRKELESKIANQAFKVYGTSLPPDATFTLRISDGVIKGYDYNGTIAPPFTTFFGLYDRHYAHGGEFPFDLPERWMNPPLELLQSKYNCVSTNDIIGGNSGSPLINRNGEAVGLIFDGNIESLPGKFIFDEEANRTVSVHAAGIYNALKYIYKAERIVKELNKR